MVRTFLIVAACLVGSSLAARAYAAEPPKVIAEGAWSTPVSDSRGYAVRGRLVLAEKRFDAERTEVAVYIELQDATEAVGGEMRIYCDLNPRHVGPGQKSGLACELRDQNERAVPSKAGAFGGAVPKSEWITLPSDATIRLRASPFGFRRTGAMAICPQLGTLWEIADGDPAEYFLSGTFTVDPDEGRQTVQDPHIWRGTLTLPPVRIVARKKS